MQRIAIPSGYNVTIDLKLCCQSECKLIGGFVRCVFWFFQPNIFVSMDKDVIERFYRYKWSRWVGPLYYNHPDGEDLGGKLSFCGQVGFFLSAPVGILNAYARTPLPTSQMGRVVRVLSAVLPGIGMGLAFAATTYYATKIRQKDDFINHILGGIAAGTILGAVNGLERGILASVVLGIAAGGMKMNHSEHIDYARRSFAPYVMRKKDFLGYPNKADNWVKAPAPQN